MRALTSTPQAEPARTVCPAARRSPSLKVAARGFQLRFALPYRFSSPGRSTAETVRGGTPAASFYCHDFGRIPTYPTSTDILQPKLVVGPPGDAYEHEADRIAAQILSSDETRPDVTATAAGTQRKCAACTQGGPTCRECAEEDEVVDKPTPTGTTPSAQRQLRLQGLLGNPESPTLAETRFGKAPGALPRQVCAAHEAPDELRRVLHSLAPIDTLSDADAKVAAVQGGKPLDPPDRAFFESRFGVDFSRVRIHADTAADTAARSVGALAYTRGRDIVFRRGMYAPDTWSGKRLLAHELTHVVQQGAARGSEIGAVQAEPEAHRIQRAVDEDGLPTISDTERPHGRRPEVSAREAERIGRDALATMGYEEIIRRALAAGFLKPAGMPDTRPAGGDPLQRMPECGLVQRQDFGTVFRAYAVAAGIASQVDSPAPGPGDLVAIGILVVGLFAALSATTTTARPCPPCPAPPPPEIDRVPPSRPHFPCPGDHWHYHVYNQNPVTCECFGPRRMFGGCCGLPIPGAPC